MERSLNEVKCLCGKKMWHINAYYDNELGKVRQYKDGGYWKCNKCGAERTYKKP